MTPPEKAKESPSASTPTGIGRAQFQLNAEELYGLGGRPSELMIEKSHWANHAFVFVAGDDVVIDFIQAPGLVRDGKQIYPAVRITMTRTTAERVSKIVQDNLAALDSAKVIPPPQTPTVRSGKQDRGG